MYSTMQGLNYSVNWGGGGRGGAYSYIRVLPDVLPDEFLLKSTVMTTDVKRNSLGRTRVYEYAPPSPINALVKALYTTSSFCS